MPSQQIKDRCVCPGRCIYADANGKMRFFRCKGCRRTMPWCFGAGDEYFDYCDDCAADLIDELGQRTNVLGTLRPGSRFWRLGPGTNRVVFGQESAEGNTVRYRYLPRDVAI